MRGRLKKLRKYLMLSSCILPSGIRIWLMRLLGAHIGHHVHLGFLSPIWGESIEIGDHVQVYPVTAIVCRKYVKLGAYTKVQSFVLIYGETGVRFEGKCYVGPKCLINATEEVSLGYYSGLGPCTQVYTHGVWLPYTQGYPRKFEKVAIGDYVWVPAGVLVLPGSVIGTGTILGAGAVVTAAIPENSYAAGNPARVLHPVSELFSGHLDLKTRINEMIHAFVSDDLGQDATDLERLPDVISFRYLGKQYRILLTEEGAANASNHIIEIQICSKSWLGNKSSASFNVESLSCKNIDSIVSRLFFNFCSRYYGVKFTILD